MARGGGLGKNLFPAREKHGPGRFPAPARVDQAARVMTAMTDAGYRGWFSIEMKARPEPGLDALEASVARLVAAAATTEQANPAGRP